MRYTVKCKSLSVSTVSYHSNRYVLTYHPIQCQAGLCLTSMGRIMYSVLHNFLHCTCQSLYVCTDLIISGEWRVILIVTNTGDVMVVMVIYICLLLSICMFLLMAMQCTCCVTYVTLPKKSLWGLKGYCRVCIYEMQLTMPTTPLCGSTWYSGLYYWVTL